MPLNLTLTEITVDTHDQEEFLHVIHQVAIAIRFIAHSPDHNDYDRDHVRDWLAALRNHAGADLSERPDALELVRKAIEADFLRIHLTATGDEHTPEPGTEL